MWLVGFLIANIGMWMQRLVQEWQTLELTHRSGAAVGLVTGLQFLPVLLAGPFGGVIADRYPKRWTLAWAQVTSALCGLALGLLISTSAIAMWQIYLIALVLGLANAVSQPTGQAFIADLADRDSLASVVGFSGASFVVARLVGPGLAGVLVLAWGTGPVFLATVVIAVCPIAILARMNPPLAPREPAGTGGLRMFADGIRSAVGNREILLGLGIVAFVGLFAANTQVTNALMATQVFGAGAGEFGLLGSMLAAGAIVGAALGIRRRTVRRASVIGTAVAFSLCTAISGVMPGYAAFAASLVLVGVCQMAFMTAANSLLQLNAEPRTQGRVMAMYMTLLTGSSAVGAPAIGAVAGHFGARAALVGSGGIALAGTLAVTAALAPGGRIRLGGANVDTRAGAESR